jgi:hypothetical protein
MYGSYHPLYARHLILEQAYYREATRQHRAAVVPNDPPKRRTRPLRPRTPITWFAPAVSLLVAATAVAALMAVDPSQVATSGPQVKTSTTQPIPPTCSPDGKVRSLQSCIPSLQVI